MPILIVLKIKYFQRNSLKFWLAGQNLTFCTRRRQWVKLKNGDFFWLYKVLEFGKFKIGKFCNALLITQEEFKEFKASKFWILILGLKIHERNKVSYLSPQIFGKTDHIILWPFKIFYFFDINGWFPGRPENFTKFVYLWSSLKFTMTQRLLKKSSKIPEINLCHARFQSKFLPKYFTQKLSTDHEKIP